ncbi:MAG: sugar ABC transporter substrate-binding protein [Methylobacteriaceae bacterium]|nr:sugar ABC transporter substrate-binding protein [Methylobacteriaceae bacterium]
MRWTTYLIGAATGLILSAQAEAATVRVVEVITSPPRTDFLKKQFAEFEQANPGTKVELISLPWGQAFEKFLTMVQAGDTPDIVEMPERWVGLYGSNGQLEDLTSYFKDWPDYATLGDRAKELGSTVNGKPYMVPYGYYIRALFWNKKLFQQAGIGGPPKTVDDFVADANKIAALGNGKTGYCLRGAAGAFGGIQIFMDTYDGKPGYFNADGTSIFNEPGAVKGLQMLADLYKSGAAPKDSVGWGFNEIVAGFYSGACAMLDQDPDALIGIKEKMDPSDFAVAPMPLGPAGKAFPSLGYSGWAMFSNSKVKPEAWKVIAFLTSPKNNIEWSKFVGVIPIHNGADQDAFFKTDQFAGWFTELKDAEHFVLVVPPTYLENLGVFYDQMVPKAYQQVLLGQRTAQDVANEWAAFLNKEQQAYMAKKK